MNSKPTVFIISGKSPLEDSGGYPAYSHTLASVITSLGYPVYTLAIGKRYEMQKIGKANVCVLETKLLKLFPFLNYLALSALPYYSLIFTKEIRLRSKQNGIRHIILWGMGPWTLTGTLLKLFPPKNCKITVIASYFTSTRHEMKGAYDAVKTGDYGIIPVIRYFLVYKVVARIFNLFEKIALNFSDLVILHYQSSRRIVQKYFNVPTAKIRIFPWFTKIFIRKGKIKALAHSLKHPLIVSICRQDPRKGINFILRALKIVSVKYPNIHGLIVGVGSFSKLNRELNKRLGLSGIVEFPGFVPDIRPILLACDIAVIVPLAQGSSALTVYEAMSFGKAIIGSDCDGIPEDISHLKNGFIVPRGNAIALAQAIETLLVNTQLRDRLGKEAKKTAKKQFAPENMISAIRNILQSIN